MTSLTAAPSARWSQPDRRTVGVWLICVCGVVIAMITLGGLTRLTGSGLSITEWHPVTGIFPPLSEPGWQAEFAKYRQIPQYLHNNRWMTLADFKVIYWWEWTHRLLGRLLGAVFLVPFLWFAWKGAIARRDWPRLLLIFALGGLQGAIGWWMVTSGLEARDSVSQYRLAVHLGTAVFLLGAILWTGLDYLRADATRATKEPAPVLVRSALGFAALVYIQMILGALVAGLHAGLVYNTWPSMDGRTFPEGAFFSSPWWINFFENPGLAQFDHRIVAYLVAASAFALWYFVRRARATGRVRTSVTAVLHMTLLQVVLGILTLLLQAPLALAALHQLTAALLFCAAIWAAFELSRSGQPVSA
jgi:cytochrome c oxidase assembly protein subunit 15